MFETKKEEFKTPYKCAYCGKAYYSIPERTKCETTCAAKAVVEEEKKKRDRVEKDKKDTLEYVNSLWVKVDEAKKLAKNAEQEMIKKYPDLARNNNSNKNNSDKFYVNLNGQNIEDEKFAREIIDVLKELHYIPSFMSIDKPLGVWTY